VIYDGVDGSMTPEKLRGKADTLLYKAKTGGRNSILFD